MGAADAIGGWLAPDAKRRMDASRSKLEAMLRPGSEFDQSGDLGLDDPGSEGYGLAQKAKEIQGKDLSANFTPMDQNAGFLRELAAQYRDQFLNGGLAEQAATARASSSMADVGGGGQQGVSNLRQGSQALSTQAGQTGNAERTAAGNAANENTLMAGMMDLQKAAFEASLTHANMEKNRQAKQAGLDLTNTQTALDQRLRQAQVQGTATMNNIGQDVKNAQTNLGFQMINAGLQAGAGAAALGTDFSKRSPVDTSVSKDALDITTEAAYNRQGLYRPASATQSYADAAHVELAANQSLLNSLMRSSVTYPGMPADSTSYLNNKDAYPVAASLRR